MLYNFNLVGGLLSPSIQKNKVVEFPVYEPELDGIMIKYKYNDRIIGRSCIPYCLMKTEYRKVPVYKNDCSICESAYVVDFFQKK